MPFPFGFQPDKGAPAYDLSDAELAASSGSVPMRHADFEYLQRDGGDVQGLGAGMEPYSFSCFYLGDDYDSRLRGLRDSIQSQPKGLLTHRELGPVRAHCLGIDEYSVDYVRERDCVNFRISFKRDETDSTAAVTATASVPSKGSQLRSTLSALAPIVSTVASLATSVASAPATAAAFQQGLLTILGGLTDFVNLFIDSAINAATLGQVDFTLQVQRDAIYSQSLKLTKTLRMSGLPDATLYPALANVQSVYALTLELDVLVRTQSPQIETEVIQGRQPLVVFSAQKYGKDAMAHLDELRINNRIGSFGLNPGQVIRYASPTVRRGLT